MKIRKIDDTSDWTFGKGKEDYILEDSAIAQNIKTRLLSWINDCFFGLQEGLDWAEYFDKGQEDNMIQAIKTVLLASYGVLAVNDISSSRDSARKITITYNIDTIFTQAFEALVEQG